MFDKKEENFKVENKEEDNSILVSFPIDEPEDGKLFIKIGDLNEHEINNNNPIEFLTTTPAEVSIVLKKDMSFEDKDDEEKGTYSLTINFNMVGGKSSLKNRSRVFKKKSQRKALTFSKKKKRVSKSKSVHKKL